ncbi:SVM family protein [Italian clover phyllody phytoplasma]|uniref:SVM family protein n=1 Tax=Italian clover phyllody phytoplasma TaxID=1196420 RepID=UPI00036229B5|nr:SVM family protein [Italian clover phyllody phytoplasma]
MFKLKNQFKIISIYLFIFLGLLLVNNNLLMANNANSNTNIPRNNNVDNNILTQIRTLHDLLLNEANLFQELYNATRDNLPQDIIINLKNQIRNIHIQSENIRINILPNQ